MLLSLCPVYGRRRDDPIRLALGRADGRWMLHSRRFGRSQMCGILQLRNTFHAEVRAMGSRTLERLRTEALELPEADRAELARDLVNSLGDPVDPTVASAWDAEILRRLKDVENGTAKAVDREEFSTRIRERISRP